MSTWKVAMKIVILFVVGVGLLATAEPVKCAGKDCSEYEWELAYFEPNDPSMVTNLEANALFDAQLPQRDCEEYCQYNGRFGPGNCLGWEFATQLHPSHDYTVITETTLGGQPYWQVMLGVSCGCTDYGGGGDPNQPASIGGRVELTTTQKVLRFFGLYKAPSGKKIGG